MLTVVWTGHGQQMSGGGRGVLVFDHDHAGHSTVNLRTGIIKLLRGGGNTTPVTLLQSDLRRFEIKLTT